MEPGGFCGHQFPGIYLKMNEEGIKLLQRNDSRKYMSQKRRVQENAKDLRYVPEWQEKAWCNLHHPLMFAV